MPPASRRLRRDDAKRCGGANWYELGERDDLIGVPLRIDTYAYQCSRQRWIGKATYRDRTAGSESN